MTVEHLLLALLDNNDAIDVLKAVGADIDRLRGDLVEFVDATTPLIPEGDSERDTQPTLGFQRVLQRAVFHVQSSGRKEVTGANVLVAIFSEQESQAVFFLKAAEHRADGRGQLHDPRHLQSRRRRRHAADPSEQDEEAAAGGEAGQPSALESFATNLNEQARTGTSIR